MFSSRARSAAVTIAVIAGLSCVHHGDRRPAPAAAPHMAGAVTHYEALSPYGEWLMVRPLGQVWRPYHQLVGPHFRPYASGGRWMYTHHGWVFDSDYPFGPVVYHYGRWLHLDRMGWVWVPDTTWGPAWVEWRMGSGYVGWAPLPPYDAMFMGVSYHRPWYVVPTRYFPYGRHRGRLVRPQVASEFVANTAPVTVRPAPGGGTWHIGPSPERVEREAEVAIVPRRIDPPAGGPAASSSSRTRGEEADAAVISSPDVHPRVPGSARRPPPRRPERLEPVQPPPPRPERPEPSVRPPPPRAAPPEPQVRPPPPERSAPSARPPPEREIERPPPAKISPEPPASE